MHPASAGAALLPAAELVPAFVKAATQLNSYLSTPQQPHQQPPNIIIEQALSLLHLWNCLGQPYTPQWVLQVLPTLAPAAELALYVLAGPGGGIAPDVQQDVHSRARQHASVTVLLLGGCLTAWDDIIEQQAVQGAGARRAANAAEAAVVSDVMQRAMLLHSAVCVCANRHHQQQQQRATGRSSSRSRSWAPTEAAHVLGQLGFPLECVEGYMAAVCKAMAHPDPLLNHMETSLTRVQCVINIRYE